jgi:hypothetical protein
MANSWLRLWHDLPTDPKFRTIARISKQPIATVMAVYIYLLTDASQNVTERGVTQCDAESVTSIFDIEIDAVKSIFDAMQGRLLDGFRIKNWDKRQPVREDNSTDRTRAYRERNRVDAVSVTQCDATERNVTQCDAPDKDKDQDKEKEKKITKKKKKKENQFETFWDLYPRKIGKAKCESKFLSLIQRNEKIENEILEGLKKYLPHFEIKPKEFIPHPITWLNQERWRDEIEMEDASPF